MESILTSIKKMLGIEEDDEHFDTDIIIFINGSITNLRQMGVGPQEGFRIKDKNETWDNFLDERDDLESVKTYIYMDVRLIFDPPTPHYAAEAMKDKLKELAWRLNVQIENEAYNDIEVPILPSPELPGGSIIPVDIERRIAANEENISTLSTNATALTQEVAEISISATEARNIANQAAITAATAGERAELGIRLANEALDQINQ